MTLEEHIEVTLRRILDEKLRPLEDALRRLTPANTDGDLLDVEAAATRLGLGESTVRKLAGKCELASVKIGRRLLFSSADLDAYQEKRRRSPERLRQLLKGGRA